MPALERMAAASGFPYVDPRSEMVESCLVVVDDSDTPVMAVAAERIVQLYGWFDKDLPPVQKMTALRVAHWGMRLELMEKGYKSAEAFLPPSICERFGRRLMRSFGWVENWRSFCFKFGVD